MSGNISSESIYPISVIIPCYRCADTIDRAIASVFVQTWRPAEIILVDDCSNDNTLIQLKKNKKKYPSGWIKIIVLLENSGPATARNVGWEHAVHPYIAFLDADDAWHHKKIEIQLGWMLKNSEVALTGHRCKVIRNYNTLSSDAIENNKFKRISRLYILITNPISTPSVIVKSNIPFRFSQKKYYSEDYLLWCEICLHGYLCCKTNLSLAFLFKERYGQAGLSGKLWLMEKGELDSFFYLYSKKKINFFCYILICQISILKFFKRLLIFLLKKIEKRWKEKKSLL